MSPDAHLAECKARMEAFTGTLLVPGVMSGDEFVNTDGARMFVAGTHYPDVLDPTCPPDWVVLTDDGGYALTNVWHTEADGPVDSDDYVRVERYSKRGMEFHGFVHRLSRKLVQTG